MTDPKQWRERKQTVDVDGTAMAVVDTGVPSQGGGLTFWLQHGNPTSSYLWRDVVAHLEPLGRCVLPDLVGMGDSARLPERDGPRMYRYVEHREVLFALLEQLDLGGRVVPVIHDWGSALGFDWAYQHPDRVAGIAYMEAIVRPVTWEEWPESARKIFQAMRSEGGEEMVLEKNVFVERILPASVLEPLPEEVMEEYRRPYHEAGESRRPTLTWPREIPVGGEPQDVVAIAEAYSTWLAGSDVPKLFVDADPGTILTGPQREFARAWPNQTVVQVPGAHFVQEDSGEAIGRHIALWAQSLG